MDELDFKVKSEHSSCRARLGPLFLVLVSYLAG